MPCGDCLNRRGEEIMLHSHNEKKDKVKIPSIELIYIYIYISYTDGEARDGEKRVGDETGDKPRSGGGLVN